MAHGASSTPTSRTRPFDGNGENALLESNTTPAIAACARLGNRARSGAGARAITARSDAFVAHRLFATESRFFERELELSLDVSLVAATHAEDTQQVPEDSIDGDVADVHVTAGKRSAGTERGTGFLRTMAEPVVHRAAILIRKDLVGEVDFFEAFMRRRIGLVPVGMVLRSQPFEGTLYFLGRGVASYSENLVVVPLRHCVNGLE